MSDGKKTEPLPEEFSSYDEAADFWGGHDTADYPEAFEAREVEVEASLLGRHFEVEIDKDLVPMLSQQARQAGVPMHRLVSDLLRRQLALSS